MLTSASLAFCGPFGLEMGMSLSQINQRLVRPAELINGDRYKVIPKNAHDFFVAYEVVVDQKYGLYEIQATSRDVPDTDYGFTTIRWFENIEEYLKEIYGNCRTLDYSKHRDGDLKINVLSEIIERSRRLSKIWDRETSKLPSAIEEIYLVVNAKYQYGMYYGYLTLSYLSDKWEVIYTEKLKTQKLFF